MNEQQPQGGLPDLSTQVRQVGSILQQVYGDLLDTSDLVSRHSGDAFETRRTSRALAAQAVRIVTGFSPEEAAATVIDGDLDQGIDAIAVVEGAEPHVYLVQSKWSGKGYAKAEREAVLELLSGLRLIDEENFAPFNPRGRRLAEYAKSVMVRGVVPVTQVVVLMRPDMPGDGFLQAIKNGEDEFNRYGDILDHRIILAPELWVSVRKDLAPKPVELDAVLFPWFEVKAPYESYQGVAAAEIVAGWADHGSHLFNLNVRNPLGMTSINNELMETLTEEPAHFLYFNNGITVLCESLEKSYQSMRAPHAYPLTIKLHNASVVNGAQTVRSVADAVAVDEGAASAQVPVRIIVTGRSADFAKRTTKATNRQNRVEPRDFIALDPVQAAIVEEMRAELGLDYSVRRGELDPPEDTGCSIVEAACALACAHPDSQYAARMAITLDVLWERGPQGIYDVLFRPQPGAYLLWNGVLILRAVRRALHTLHPRYEGRGAALIEHGPYLLAHLVFRSLNTEAIDEPDPKLEWSTAAVARVSGLIKELLPTVAATIDRLYGDRSQIRAACADVVRCREITDHVLDGGVLVPDPAERDRYRRVPARRNRRRSNAVHALIDHGVLEEGAPLTLTTAHLMEAEALAGWLAEDERRSRATWVKHRARPLLWAADGKQYSPSGLIAHMWELAQWDQRPVANQGTTRWLTSTGETLADVAWRVLSGFEEPLSSGAGD
ncbi:MULTISPECIES: AIPR family protein [unclassified Streptomyces]|uniref:AIPR family protein n=1 Tax=unclassified Streptomyces TaxID=2593676 RepID=UPI0003600E45|nr:AIPR family protein [Streptomyces sp. LaPpAH-202]MYW60347.1 abortive phage infection protein [Streptomyces sp. SID8370]MYW87750.1 abortive phage infection protein [Streptomyces sp. SID8371]